MQTSILKLLTLGVTLLPLLAEAQSIAILDCNGFTRALKAVDDGSLNRLELHVTDATGAPSTGAEVSITNAATGEVSTAVTNNGIAVFKNVAEGAYTLNAGAGAAVGEVAIGSMTFSTAATTAAAAGAATAAGGTATGVVVGVEEVASTINESNEEEPEPQPTAIPTPLPTAEPPAPTPAPTLPPATPEPTATPDDCDCDPGAKPTPIDPDDFLNPQPTPMRPQLSPAR